MRVLRTIVGVTRRDRIRNATIREKLGVIQLLEEVERMKLRWYGHIIRMDEERKQKMYLQWKPDAKRPVGPPRKRWMEGIKTAIERRGRSLTELEEDRSYEDRKNWRRFLKNMPADRQ